MQQAGESSAKNESNSFGKVLYTVGGFLVGGLIGRIASNIIGAISIKPVIYALDKNNTKPLMALGITGIILPLGSSIIGAVKGYGYAKNKEKQENEAKKALEEIRQSIHQKPKEIETSPEQGTRPPHSRTVQSRQEYGSHAAATLADKAHAAEADLVR
jgi:hypothetical protein